MWVILLVVVVVTGENKVNSYSDQQKLGQVCTFGVEFDNIWILNFRWGVPPKFHTRKGKFLTFNLSWIKFRHFETGHLRKRIINPRFSTLPMINVDHFKFDKCGKEN